MTTLQNTNNTYTVMMANMQNYSLDSYLLGFCFTPNTSILIHTPPWCVRGRNRRYLVNTP